MTDDHGIDDALKQRGRAAPTLNRRSLTYLRDTVLVPGERVLALGAHGIGVMAVTTVRAVFVHKDFVVTQVKDIPLSQISSMKLEKRWLSSTVIVTSPQTNMKVDSLINGDAEGLLKAYEQSRHGSHDTAAGVAAAMPTTTAEDVFAQLERLRSLRESGVLTEEEYTAKKAKMLDRL